MPSSAAVLALVHTRRSRHYIGLRRQEQSIAECATKSIGIIPFQSAHVQCLRPQPSNGKVFHNLSVLAAIPWFDKQMRVVLNTGPDDKLTASACDAREWRNLVALLRAALKDADLPSQASPVNALYHRDTSNCKATATSLALNRCGNSHPTATKVVAAHCRPYDCKRSARSNTATSSADHCNSLSARPRRPVREPELIARSNSAAAIPPKGWVQTANTPSTPLSNDVSVTQHKNASITNHPRARMHARARKSCRSVQWGAQPTDGFEHSSCTKPIQHF